MAALLYLILLAGLGGSLFLFFTSRQGGGEDMTLIGLGGAGWTLVDGPAGDRDRIAG